MREKERRDNVTILFTTLVLQSSTIIFMIESLLFCHFHILVGIFHYRTRLVYSNNGCRCQNRRISGRGSRTVHQGRMVTGDKGHDVFTQVRALSMDVIPYSCLINIDDMGSTRVDLPRDQGG